jgi:hypothetical protein
MQRVVDQCLVGVRTVGIGGIDERDASLDHSLEQCDPARTIGIFAPHPSSGEAHRAVAEPVDDQIGADRDGV